jgi:membrane fusion protein (multidrug efflux system)
MPDGPAAPQPAPRHHRALRLFLVGTAVTAAIVVALLSWDAPFADAKNPQTLNAYVDGDVTPLSARVQGFITRLPITDNQPVRAGELIATIDDADYRSQAEQADAQVAVAAASLRSLDGQILAARRQVDEASAALQAAQAGLVSDAPESVRQRRLAPTDAGLTRNVEAAVAAARVTNAGVARARAQLAAVRTQLDVLAAQRDQAQGVLAARQADAALAHITLGWTQVRSPVDGVLGARQVRVGSLVGPGSVIVSVTPLAGVWVTANFTERQIAFIAPGRRARLRVDAFPDAVLDGHVVGLSPATGATFSATPADNTTGNYTKVVQRVPVKIAFDWNGSRLLGLVRPGMSVVALVATDADAPDAPWHSQ